MDGKRAGPSVHNSIVSCHQTSMHRFPIVMMIMMTVRMVIGDADDTDNELNHGCDGGDADCHSADYELLIRRVRRHLYLQMQIQYLAKVMIVK